MSQSRQQLRLLEQKVDEAIDEIKRLRSENATLKEQAAQAEKVRQEMHSKNLTAQRRIEQIIENLETAHLHPNP